MPIPREKRFYYPIDWPQISAWVRFERARGRCEHCGRPHKRRITCVADGRWLDEEAGLWRGPNGKPARTPPATMVQRTTYVVLAAAHLNHDPPDCRPRNLKSLCQRCHILHDRQYHRRQARITILMRRALGDLFEGPYRR